VIASIVGLVSAAYLLARGAAVFVRVARARRAYPILAITPARTEQADRARGALLGHAAGDALGLPAESLPRWLIRLRYPGGPRMRGGVIRLVRRAGDVSDDTQLAIAAALSIEPDGRYDHQRFVAELARFSRFRVAAGRATSRAAIRARRGRADTGISSEGNGVAIRAVSLAIATAGHEEAALARAIERNAAATHTTEAAWRAALFVALLIREALRRPAGALADGAVMFEVIASGLERSGFDVELPVAGPIDSDAEHRRHLEITGTSAHVYQCVPAAALILLRHRLDIAAAMRAAFFAGGDTDSVAAMVGSVIGAQVGEAGLPRRWVGAVQHRAVLCALGDRLSSFI
jgi:ADP-ribosylglycohydrolase